MEDQLVYDTYIRPEPPQDLPAWSISMTRELVRQTAAPGHYTIHLDRTHPRRAPRITITKVERLCDWVKGP